MLASTVFQNILDQVQASNLNFQLVVSPFSAQISLKKSLAKDQAGNLLLPSTGLHAQSYDSFNKNHDDIQNLVDQNKKLKKELFTLQKNHERVVIDFTKACETVENLENQINHEIKLSDIEKYENEIRELKLNNEALQSKIDEQDDIISELNIINKNSKEGSARINKELHELKIKYSKEKTMLIKDHKTEVKAWRKDLGDVNKENIKLKAKLEKMLNKQVVVSEASVPPDNPLFPPEQEQQTESGAVCSICADPIINYKPKNFLGELFDSACSKCDDSFEGDDTGPDTSTCMHTPQSQCVSRQPYPPPSPSMPYIFQEVSKYHLHMMSKSDDDLTGCLKCFSIDNENYGCDKCTWLKCWFKWHGERHGLPDIHPSNYRKYL